MSDLTSDSPPPSEPTETPDASDGATESTRAPDVGGGVDEPPDGDEDVSSSGERSDGEQLDEHAGVDPADPGGGFGEPPDDEAVTAVDEGADDQSAARADQPIDQPASGAQLAPDEQPAGDAGAPGPPETAGPPETRDSAESLAQQRLDSGVETPAGRVFFGEDDGIRDLAMKTPEVDGTRMYAMHGNPNEVLVNGERLSPSQLGDVIRADPGWSGEPVALMSCETGKVPEAGGDTFAQKLADDIGAPVTAPTELAWFHSDGSVTSQAGVYDANGDFVPGPPAGQFETFSPREVDDQ